MKIITFLFLFIYAFSFGQKKEGQLLIDSLLIELPKMSNDTLKVNLLNELADTYKNTDSTKCLLYVKHALSLSRKINFKLGEVDSYRILGKFYNDNFNIEKAISNYNYAIKICLTTNDQIRLARLYNSLGNVYNDLNNYSIALNNYFKAVKINEKLNKKNNLASNYSNIAQIYKGLDDHKKSKYFLNLSIEFALQSKDNNLLTYNYITYTQILEKEKDYTNAGIYAQKAYRLANAISDEINIAVSLFGIGLIEARNKNFDAAIITINKALKKFNDNSDEMGKASAYSELGLCYFKMNEEKKNQSHVILSKENFNKSNEIYKSNNLIDGLPDNYFYLSKIYELEKNAKDELINYKLYTKYKDSILNSSTKETIKNIEDKREIELRDKEIKINKLSLEANEKQKWFYICGLFLIGIIGSLVFIQSRNRQKVNQKLQLLNTQLDQKNTALDEANKNKTRFFSIINHDLRSPVSNLIDFLHIQKDSPELLDIETKIRIQETTLTSAENLLSSMEDILLWSKGQMENFKPVFKKITVSSLFEDIRKHFSSEEKVKISFENPNNVEIETDEDYLKTIVRNLTGNALKVLNKTENPTIIWKVYTEKNQIFISISDNGSGGTQEDFKALYDEKEVMGIKTGLGLHLIRDLSKAINCEINVESIINKGTTFVLSFNVD